MARVWFIDMRRVDDGGNIDWTGKVLASGRYPKCGISPKDGEINSKRFGHGQPTI